MKYVFGNWKMYLDFDETNIMAHGLLDEYPVESGVEVCIFPMSLALREVAQALQDSVISVGAQNVCWASKGAYTGEVSAMMYKDVGCKYALIGHSERRHIFKETDNEVRKKIEACIDVGLIPVVCIGETKEEKQDGKREYRLKKQLFSAFSGLEGQVFVAYEPVWAIGTGDACDPNEASTVHKMIKEELKQYFDEDVPVLYGGSVNSENVVSYTTLGSVDGVLVGGASTKLESFVPLIQAVAEAK